MIGREATVKKVQQLRELSREVIGPYLLTAITAQSVCLQRSTTRRASHAQVNPAGIESMKHPKRLRNFQRAVVRQQHSAGTDAHGRSLGRYHGDQDLRSGTG